MEENKKEFKIEIIFFTYWLIVLVAKILRYTVLKETLVYMSIGNGWISSLTQGGNSFLLSFGGSVSVASENSKALFQIFRYFGLNVYSDYEIVITIIWNLIFAAILLTLKNKMTLSQLAFVIMTIAVLNIWDFCLAKEPLQMLYFVAIYFVLISKKIPQKAKFPLAIGIILFSCISYRNYYILIVAFSVLAYLLIGKYLNKKDQIRWYDIVLIMAIYGIAYMLIIIFTKHFDQDAYNAFIYFNSRVTKAKTDLSGLFHSGILPIMAFDYILLVIRMLFPIELLKFGPQYWLYALYQIITSAMIIKSLLKIKTNGPVKMCAIYLYIGFLFASATFEPDFGSWIRHNAVTAPIILIVSDLFDETHLIHSRKEIVDEE